MCPCPWGPWKNSRFLKKCYVMEFCNAKCENINLVSPLEHKDVILVGRVFANHTQIFIDAHVERRYLHNIV